MKPSGAGGSAPDHYSYSVYADPATARTFDARRFGGPIGELIAETQADILRGFVAPIREREILDVGTGTGRAAMLLAREGGRVTAVDASDEMLAVARRRAADEHVDVSFRRGDIHALEFDDQRFSAVISLRVLMHTPDWRRSLAELCRVARELVVFDYPAAVSAAAVQSMARRLARSVGLKSEAYRVFTDREIARQLSRHRFRVRATHRQFVLPIAFHKAIGSRRFTERAEHLLGQAGLLERFGSPVTVVAERCASS